MQDHVKFLAVDDVTEWADQLKQATEEYFVNKQRFAKARVRGFTAYNAVQADSQIEVGGWDLVLLDMNLGEGSSRKGARERISGLDLLGDIARGNRAYFVIIVTGAVTDPDLEKFYGQDTAALLRLGAMNEAVKRMPASRVRILHKPNAKSVREAIKKLHEQLCSALDQYCSVSIERNIFRPLPGDPKLWEICFNGGPRITIPTVEPYKMIRSALAQPDRAFKVIQLMQALANSSGRDEATAPAEKKNSAPARNITNMDSPRHQEDVVSGADGLDFTEIDGFEVTGYAPVDTDEGTLSLEDIIGSLLYANRRGLPLATAVQSFAESDIKEEVLLAVPGAAARWAAKGSAADGVFGSNSAAAELMALVRDLRPLLTPIRERWLKKKAAEIAAPVKRAKTRSKIRVAKGVDTDEMMLCRQHWKRFHSKAYIGGHPALKEFQTHILEWIPRGAPTTKGHLHYKPPGSGEFCPFWLTK